MCMYIIHEHAFAHVRICIHIHVHAFACRCTAHCNRSVVSSISIKLWSNSRCLFCHVPSKTDQLVRDWSMRLNHTANAIGCTYKCTHVVYVDEYPRVHLCVKFQQKKMIETWEVVPSGVSVQNSELGLGVYIDMGWLRLVGSLKS